MARPTASGAIIGWVYDRWAARFGHHAEAARRLGVLLASGLIVGESLFNVALAGLIGATSKGEPLALVGDDFAAVALVLSVGLVVIVIAAAYLAVGRAASALLRRPA